MDRKINDVLRVARRLFNEGRFTFSRHVLEDKPDRWKPILSELGHLFSTGRREDWQDEYDAVDGWSYSLIAAEEDEAHTSRVIFSIKDDGGLHIITVYRLRSEQVTESENRRQDNG